MKRSVIGILAHVDAGKTTLAEAVLYKTGAIRSQGRVDSGSSALDTHEIERQRGITIFASQAEFTHGELSAVLLDTPGHADFAAETERTLAALDYAILVISGTDGVQAHTRTLWRLLEQYDIPVFIFVSKTDLGRRSREDIMDELRGVLSGGCTDFDADAAGIYENAAMCSEDILNKYIETGELADEDISALIADRKIFPCLFGSGLRGEGVEKLLDTLERYITDKKYPDEFGARVYKISYDEKGARLTHMKITGGALRVRDRLGEEKVSQIRIYSGARYTAADEAAAGSVCAVTGLEQSMCGSGYGFEENGERHFIEPVMKYRLILPEGSDPKQIMPKLKRFEEEDPLLKIEWNSFLREINIALMGEVQTEVLRSLINKKLGIDVGVDQGRVMYKETIAGTVEGAGHYEPLRHYAEVHLILSPAERGEGLVFGSVCAEDELDRNWQRLILTHLAEKQHLGVLTGSPLTDVKITLAAGRAHLKHTEGGDFRQATYRAVRQGLMKAQSVLLEPYYDFTIEVPAPQAGKALSDIKMRSGEAEIRGGSGDMTVIKGSGPVSTMNNYAAEVTAYTGGRGTVLFSVSGYRECHNAAEVIENISYSPENDTENTADSVFCSHGAGHTVKWDEADGYMHIRPRRTT